ncbi:unnamed protein product [Parajaminaea phylloscopi]
MITVTSADDDGVYALDCDTGITLDNVKALLEADSGIPAAQQTLYFDNAVLADATRTLDSYGVKDGDLILLRASATPSANPSGAASSQQPQAPASAMSEEAMAEQLRQQVLSDDRLMAQLSQSNPQLAQAARSSSTDFLRLLGEFRRQMADVQSQRQRAEAELAAADEFDIDAQRRIEEAIQQENIAANLEHAIEYNPENFGRVHMLYVKTEVNGVEVKAFVDSGAQMTIMSPDCAERCGLMRLVDRRFAGIARGVGTAKILGRVHSAQIKLSETLFLPCSFTVMEGKGVECLFGLDMLKRYQASIDLSANALIINGEHCRFLDEHELPESAKELGGEDEEAEARSKADAAASSAAGQMGGQTLGSAASLGNTRPSASGAGPFPGSGQTIAERAPGQGASHAAPPVSSQHQQQNTRSDVDTPMAPPSSETAPSSVPAGADGGRRTFPPASMKALQDLGASESQARALLEAAGGNVEVAAGLLFHGQ